MTKNWQAYAMTFFKGMAMGAADVVPGVSGGTIAFITGVYTRLINALGSIGPDLLRVWREQGISGVWHRIDATFLVTLFAGILTSVVTLAGILKYLLENQPVLIGSFFFGLVAASVVVLLREVPRWHITSYLLLGAGIIAAVLISIVPGLQGSHGLWFMFFAGALAICAMILPGISGAFILLLLGAYHQVLAAVHEFDLVVLAVTGAGAVVGLLTFTHVLKWLFAHYYGAMMALLTGFVAGSLYKIWPWQVNGVHLMPWADAAEHVSVGLLLIGAGIALVLVMTWLGRNAKHES